MCKALSILLFCAALAFPQEPLIVPGGVLNAATYATGGAAGNGIAPGSLAVLFGSNLATDTLTPDQLLLPTRLGGVSVLVGEIPSPLLFVSPNQIDFQMPMSITGPTTVVVSTAAGTSRPYPINAVDSFGIFTRDPGGCGAAAALNTAADGSLTLNATENSISPGDTLAIFGTGLYPVSPAPPDGVPAASTPLSLYTGAIGGTVFDVNGPSSPHAFAGLAAGLVGTDQVNVRVPLTAREGCAVPLLTSMGAAGNSKPVTLSIRRGGGACVDPPPAGYGIIQWVKTISGAAEADSVTVSLQSSPGKQRPPAPVFKTAAPSVASALNFGPQCPVPGYRSLDAGGITVQGVGLPPTQAELVGVGPPESGQVAGLIEHFAVLPQGTIRPGAFTVMAKGGADVAAFQSTLQIGAGIDISTPLPAGTILHRQSAVAVSWTGGDASSWVTLKLVIHHGSYDQILSLQARASDGVIAMSPTDFAALLPGPVELELDVEPETPAPLAASGLSLGGHHTWKYIYRFPGLLLE